MSVRTRTQNRPSGAVHGVMIVDKPQGLTSHDVVGAVRRARGTRRVGHAGTLDPMATGVLVVLLGEATKLSGVLTTDSKVYEAEVTFGSSTDSLDAEGTVLKRVELSDTWLDLTKLEVALESERKRTLQIPPQVSAIKVDGQRAYARARQGQVTELSPRDVKVHELVLLDSQSLSASSKRLRLRLQVSKGYYVRSLAHDLATALGVPGHLSGLRRLSSGPFQIDQTTEWPPSDETPLIPLAEATRIALPVIQVNAEGAERLLQGKRLLPEQIEGDLPASPVEPIAAFHQKRLLALLESSGGGEFKVKRGMNDPDHSE